MADGPVSRADTALDDAIAELVRGNHNPRLEADDRHLRPLVDIGRAIFLTGHESEPRPEQMARVWKHIRRETGRRALPARPVPARIDEQPKARSLSGREKWGLAIAGGLTLGAMAITLAEATPVPTHLAVVPSVAILLTSLGYRLGGRKLHPLRQSHH